MRRESGDKVRLPVSLGNQALILRRRGQVDEARELHHEKEQICRELDLPDGPARSLGLQADVALKMDRPGTRRPPAEAYRLVTQPISPTWPWRWSHSSASWGNSWPGVTPHQVQASR